MKFTYEQIEKILDEAMTECLQPVKNNSQLEDYMDKAYNNGIRIMAKETLYRVLLKETGQEGNS